MHLFAAIECRAGYEAAAGDVEGFGNLGSAKDVATTDACGQICDQTPDRCCSYEWSPTAKRCNLNKECQPTQGQLQDYGLCHKGAS